jgi:hypothetical protein
VIRYSKVHLQTEKSRPQAGSEMAVDGLGGRSAGIARREHYVMWSVELVRPLEPSRRQQRRDVDGNCRLYKWQRPDVAKRTAMLRRVLV